MSCSWRVLISEGDLAWAGEGEGEQGGRGEAKGGGGVEGGLVGVMAAMGEGEGREVRDLRVGGGVERLLASRGMMPPLMIFIKVC